MLWKEKVVVNCQTQWLSLKSSKIDQELITDVSIQVVEAFQKDFFQIYALQMWM